MNCKNYVCEPNKKPLCLKDYKECVGCDKDWVAIHLLQEKSIVDTINHRFNHKQSE